jgi:uncharacterized membrane protein (DUF373 family)
MRREIPRNWSGIRDEWPALTAYQRFEATVALLLTIVIASVIVVALGRLMVTVAEVLIIRALNPLEHAIFQLVFGEILTLLIALEFNHTLTYVIAREKGIVQARAVIVIAELALARKVIVTDLTAMSPLWMSAVAALVVSLGVAYWLASPAQTEGCTQSRCAAASCGPGRQLSRRRQRERAADNNHADCQSD